ncbi:glycine--tRNA ligase subunit beta [Facilibium subflavum]|uniref:glycine--tRNA ligase subunit beta n=1 Tax=Facilibium subflavum TaxID=2219058 RepID=UPI000E64D20B|nr:glycine--tRNA ligase subunit beta [Facilibium subflavum]
MSQRQDLLFELGTEELPPKALKNLTQSLLKQVCNLLDDAGIYYGQTQTFASPRRIGFLLKDVDVLQKDKLIDREGPFLEKAYDDKGQPTKAALGFARSCNVDFNELKTIDSKKGKRLFYQVTEQGQATEALVPEMIQKALKKLPIPKTMRWGDVDFDFVRPVHWALLLFGNKVIDAEFFGCKTSNITYGHRFHHPQSIKIDSCGEYEASLRDQGKVMVDWDTRKSEMLNQAKQVAQQNKVEVIIESDLAEEVTAIIEWPHALCCSFDAHFLRVPQEALISAMQEHQKCFPMVDEKGKLVNKFITISNIDSKKPETVVKGNNKVMAARLADAAFFYDTDVKKPLEDYLLKLKSVTFQKQLGSLYDRALRIAMLAKEIAKKIDANQEYAYEAGLLAKADLATDMVFEFTDLQGIIGKYYAKAQGKPEIVCQAIEQQYWPKQSGGVLPETNIAQSVSLAEKLDTLVGIFGIGQKPTGEKDPFALRRAAISVLRILKEKHLAISLDWLIDVACDAYDDKLIYEVKKPLLQFFIDRLKVIYKESDVNPAIFESVLAVSHENVVDFDLRIQAVLAFLNSPVAEDLSQSNKRVSNILTKNQADAKVLTVDVDLFQQDEELALFHDLEKVNKTCQQMLKQQAYTEVLEKLTKLDKPINAFFDHVMVMTEDEKIRNNRLALLQKLHTTFKQVADIAKLS